MKLSDTQLVVLAAAAKRDDGAILPLPESIKGGAAAKVVDGLIRRGLAEHIESNRPAIPDLVRVTRAGLEAIGVEPEAGDPPAAAKKPARKGKHPKGASPKPADGGKSPRTGTKQAQLIAMLKRPEGATVAEIAETFGWQHHTVRGVIAGALKKKLGLDVTSEKVEDRRVYRIIG